MPSLSINQRIKRFRQELEGSDAVAREEMVRAYRSAWEAIDAQLRCLSLRVAAAEHGGSEHGGSEHGGSEHGGSEEAGAHSPSWIYQQARLRAFAQTIASEISKLTGTAQGVLSGLTVDFVRKAQDHVQELIRARMGRVPAGVTPSFTRLNPGVLESIASASGPGSPVAALFDEMPGGTAERVSVKLTNGLALGQGMQEVARSIWPEVGGNLVRSIAIVRTESLRAYRSAAIANYSANSDVVKGWMWSCQKSRRSCSICLAMDGSIHPLEEPFGSHVACRCLPIPYTASWAELGFDDLEDGEFSEIAPEDKALSQTGEEWFAAQDADTQKAILGPGKFDLYKAGNLDLTDLIGYRVDPVWGEVRYERSIKDIEANGRRPLGNFPVYPVGKVD